MSKCPYCGLTHEGKCPYVKAMDFYPDGTLKRVEFHEGIAYQQVLGMLSPMRKDNAPT